MGTLNLLRDSLRFFGDHYLSITLLATPIERYRAHGAPIRHQCSVASAQDAGDGQDQGGLIF